MDFENLANFDEKLNKIEDNIVIILNKSLNRDFNRIEKVIEKNYSKFKNNKQLLPDERARVVFSKIDDKLRTRDKSGSLRKALNQTNTAALSFYKAEVSNQDLIDFWVIDSNNRIQDWGSDFLKRVQATLRLAYAQRWSKSLTVTAIRKEFGRLKSQVAKIASTAITSIVGETAKKYAQLKNLPYLIFRTAEDERVCKYCGAREGNIYKLKDISVPLHPFCRCVLIPITNSQLRDLELREKLARLKETALNELAEAGSKPSYGAAPFERNQLPPDPQ